MSSEQRVYAHYKKLKMSSPMRWVKDYDCTDDHNGRYPHSDVIPHMHGHNETTTSNHIWLLLARVHKMPVRRVKDIVSAKRGWKPRG